MTKYERLKNDLIQYGTGTMKCFGNSMLPKLSNPSTCTYVVQDEYDIGDIVFSKVKGRYIDAHQITKKIQNGQKIQYLISNNHGFDNGWTRQVFGKVIKATNDQGIEKTFA